MHDLALMDDLVNHISEQVRERVNVVRLEIGRDSCVFSDALRFCFDVCAKETVFEGASLDIVAIEGDAMRLKEIEVISSVDCRAECSSMPRSAAEHRERFT